MICRFIWIWLWTGLSLLACDPPVRDTTLSAETRGELDVLADQIYRDTEEKYHILSKIIVKVMEEAMELQTEEETIAHLAKFSSDNQLALQVMREEIDDWFKGMDEETRTHFLIRLVAEDYPRKMRRLIPQVRQRISGRDAAVEQFESLLNTLELRR